MLRFTLRKLTQPHIWRRIFLERLTEPLHLNVMSPFVLAFGGFRAKVAWDLVPRHHTAYGLLKAADYAAALGLEEVTAIEFGVAAGAGLLNLCEVAARVTRATGIRFRIVGFDTGRGMPPPRDYRDHPEYYAEGDFPTDVAALSARLPANARLVVGDVAETVPAFVAELTASAPVGFVAVDVDYYWSAVESLAVFTGPADRYLPITLVYLDDVEEEGVNPWCGELLAVNQFNDAHPRRKITPFNFLRQRRIFRRAKWIDHLFALHVLDHPTRSAPRRPDTPVRLINPYLPPERSS